MDNKQVVEEFKREQAKKTEKMLKLLENPLFEELVLKDYLEKDVLEIVMTENLDSSSAIDALKARQRFKQYLFGLLSNG